MGVDEITFFRHWKQEHPIADFAAIAAHCRRRAEELAEDKHKATFLRKWAEIAEEGEEDGASS